MAIEEQTRTQPPSDSDAPARKITGRLAASLSQHRFPVGYAIIVVTSAAWLTQLAAAWMRTGAEPFQGFANDLLAGRLPYRDRVLEYPPYSIPIFLLPSLLFGREYYLGGFTLLTILGDFFMKFLLLSIGLRQSKTLWALSPLLFYCVSVPFLRGFILELYDIWPALICVAIVCLACSERHFLCGLALALGIGVKLYPVVFLPPLFVLAVRQGKGGKFAAGLAAGLLPILLLSFYLPWWRFAEFQGSRGLQVESLYASILWLGEQLDLTRVEWVWSKSWYEGQGQLASDVIPLAHGIFIAAMGISTAIAVRIASKCEKPGIGEVSRMLLVPLLCFVGFNLVFSPQYMLWLLSLAALGSLKGNPWIVLMIPLATCLTWFFYPSPEYNGGLNLPETIILVCRNLVVITTCVMLVREAIPSLSHKSVNSSGASASL